jgi:hypothetical protein
MSRTDTQCEEGRGGRARAICAAREYGAAGSGAVERWGSASADVRRDGRGCNGVCLYVGIVRMPILQQGLDGEFAYRLWGLPGRKDSVFGAGKDFVEWVDPGAGGQVAVNKGAAALLQAASTARARVREQPLAYQRPIHAACRTAPGPPFCSFWRRPCPIRHARVESPCHSAALCSPLSIHPTPPHQRAAPPPSLARLRASQPMQATARRRGRPPFAVNTSDCGECAASLYEAPGVFWRAPHRDSTPSAPPSSRFCAPVQRCSCDSLAEGLPVCVPRRACALPRPRRHPQWQLRCLGDCQKTCKD